MVRVVGLPYWRLSGFYFLFLFTLGGFIPYWSLYLKSIGLSSEEIGILSAIVLVNKIFSSFLWGWIVDRTGRHMLVVRCTGLLSMLFFSCTLFFQDFWSLAIILFLLSIFWTAALPQIDAMTLLYLGKSRGFYTTIRIWGSIGFIIGVLALGKYFDDHPIDDLLPILMGCMFLTWLHSLFIPDKKFSYIKQNAHKLLKILLKPSVIFLLIICFLMYASHGSYHTFFSVYLEKHNYSSSFIGVAWGVGALAEVIIYIFIHRVICIVNHRYLMILTLVLATIRWIISAYFADNIVILLFAQCLHAATFGIYHAVAIQYIYKEFGDTNSGRGQGLYNSVGFGAGLAFGSLISGYLWDIEPSYIYLFSAVLSTVGILFACFGLKK